MRINYLSRQDIKIILHYLGYIMIGIGVILLVPILIDLCYLENRYFIGCSMINLNSSTACSYQVSLGYGQDL